VAKDIIKFGDYVQTDRHGYRGRVYKFERLTNADQAWVDGQSLKVTIEDIQGEWVGILVHDGGAVLTPIASCRKIPTIKDFKHHCAKEHFGA
jgi:hypothetical protein